MNSNLFFFLIACISVSFTIIVICNGPVINSLISIDPTENCQFLRDDYDNDKKTIDNLSEDAKKLHKRKIHKCERDKALYGLEYSALIMDIFFGFVCSLLGLLNYFGAAKSFEKIIGLIGLISGAICFIMTLVYICYSGYIFTNDSDEETIKLDEDGLFAEYKDGKYSCKYFDKDEPNSLFAKYNELGKKQYNYNKDNYFIDQTSKTYLCTTFSNSIIDDLDELCLGSYTGTRITVGYGTTVCESLYYNIRNTNISNKYKYDKWVTSIIFGVFVAAINVGLALFGFLIFKNGGSSDHTPI